MFIKKYFEVGETKDNRYLLINSIFGFFPISFILGSLSVDLNLIAFCLLGVFYLKPKFSEIKLNFPLKIILFFFIIVIISTSISLIRSLYIEGYDQVNSIRLISIILCSIIEKKGILIKSC